MNNTKKAEDFKLRTKIFAIRIIKFIQSFPNSFIYWEIGKQLLKSSTSVAANYRAACRARSDAEFFSKISIVVEEADETLFWLELIKEAELSDNKELDGLLKNPLRFWQ